MIKYRKSIAIFGVVAVFLSVFMLMLTTNVHAANVQTKNGEIKVFLGNTDDLNLFEARAYTTNQSSALEQLATETPEENGRALITFEQFLSPEEVVDIIPQQTTIKTAYLWVPNKTGRAIINIENGDVKETISNWIESLDLDNEPESKYKSDMLDLEKNYGIFAVEIEQQYKSINTLAAAESVKQVDVFYNEYAEELSSDTGYSISYIAVPSKPDGTN